MDGARLEQFQIEMEIPGEKRVDERPKYEAEQRVLQRFPKVEKDLSHGENLRVGTLQRIGLSEMREFNLTTLQ